MTLWRIVKTLDLKHVLIEVFIIVIGILIALQIDNWKESYDTKQREIKLLNELRSELISDLHTIGEAEKRCNDVISSLGILQLHLFNKKSYQDSLQDHAFKIVYEIFFQFRSSAFYNVRATGVDIVSNDSIKLKIVELYDFTYPRLSRMIETSAITDQYAAFYNQYKILKYKKDEGDSGIQITEIIDPKVFSDIRFLDLVTTKMGSFIVVKRRFQQLHKQVESLIHEIDKELKI